MPIRTSNSVTIVEYKKILKIEEWYLATSKDSGITISTDGWTTEVQHINDTNKYLWNYEKVIYSIGDPDVSDPVIIGVYNEAETGRGIEDIVEYYAITSDTTAPSLNDDWKLSVPILTPENKYLWNYEVIKYTDGTEKQTQAAIIGVYGDSGVDAITFEIYSVDGFIFKEDVASITLNIASFEGSTEIKNATYQWSWWNESENRYIDIDNNDENDKPKKELTVNKFYDYALSNLRCAMTYDGNTYYDYVTLSKETVIYTSVVKFFDGSNILQAEDLYIVAYIELYRNNDLVETLQAPAYCRGISTVNLDTNVISPSGELSGAFNNDDLMYFIINASNEDETVKLYDAILGKYSDGAWYKTDSTTKYEYQNSLYANDFDNIVVISKESVNKSQNVDFTIFKNSEYISNTSVNIVDSNDPIISDIEPESPVFGQLWLDTSSVPYVLKIYTQIQDTEGGEWVKCSEKIGGAIFTSRPSSYNEGDLWILADGENCGDYGPGSMLKSIITSKIFNESHWIDADEDGTMLKQNIKQYFQFNADTGLKIGQKDEKFYVNISATEMGLYDNSDPNYPNKKAVSIGNNSSTIKNLVAQDNATFDCNVKFVNEINIFDKFVLKKETDGSVSLVVAK